MQRGLPLGVRHRENVDARRFAVEPGARVCVPPQAGHVGRTACYAEHNARRKNCPLLSANGHAADVGHDPGLYVNGLSPYDGEDAIESEENLLILGPYVKDSQNVTLKRVSFNTVFERHSNPENVAPRFTVWRDVMIPSIAMLRDTAQSLRETSPLQMVQNLKACSDELTARQKRLKHLQQKCGQRADLMRICRRILKNVFLFAMYARRWAGPGTPYPITRSQTNRNVGQHTRISDDLVDMVVHVTAVGEVMLRERKDEDDESADRVEAGKAIAMMDAHLMATFNSVDDMKNVADRRFLIDNLPVAIPQPTTDGTHWPAEEKLWDTLFGGETSVAQATTCIRQVSSTLLHTCKMLTPILYKTQPQWMRYEGVLDEIQ